LKVYGAVLLLFALTGVPHLSNAETFLPSGDNSISLDAADSVEWDQRKRTFVAAGKAVVSRGDLILKANKISANYRDGKDKKIEIYQIIAEGNIEIKNKDDRATSNLAKINTDNNSIILSGKNTSYWNKNIKLVANKEIEYHSNDQRAFARGGIEISTANEVIKADEVIYDLKKQLAEVLGNIRITRGDNVLLGGMASFDFKSGISRISGSNTKNPSSTGRVRGLISPQGKP
jgi:lipopolysaccharide export system protein LptA